MAQTIKQDNDRFCYTFPPLNIAWGGGGGGGGSNNAHTDIMFQSSSISTWWVSGSITLSEGSGALSFVGHACLQFRICG